jgi:hypothetical protein
VAHLWRVTPSSGHASDQANCWARPVPATTTDRSNEGHAEAAESVESHIGSPTPSLLVLHPGAPQQHSQIRRSRPMPGNRTRSSVDGRMCIDRFAAGRSLLARGAVIAAVSPTHFPSPRTNIPDRPPGIAAAVGVERSRSVGHRRTVATETKTETTASGVAQYPATASRFQDPASYPSVFSRIGFPHPTRRATRYRSTDRG